MDIEVKLIDYEKIYSMINDLNDIEKNKTIKYGLRRASNIFVQAGKVSIISNQNVDSGKMLSSLITKVKKEKLGALAGFTVSGNQSHLIDKGTVERVTKSGKKTGKITGNNFWQDAVNANENTAIDTIYTSIQKAIENLMKK